MLTLAVPLVLDSGNPIEEPIKWILGSIGSYLHQNVSTSTVTDPLSLLVPLKDPNTAVAQSPLVKIVPTCLGNGGACDFEKIASSVRMVGYALFAIVLLARMLKLAAIGRLRSPEHLLLDLAPKLLLGIGAIQYFDQALNDASQVSMGSTFLLEDAILFPIHLTVTDLLTAFPTQGLGFLLMPTLYLLLAYLVLLVVTSRLVLLLGALISPLGIPIAIQNEQGKLAGTWIRMIVSGLLVPVLAGIGTAGSLALAWLVHQIAGNGPFVGSYLGALTGEGGLFFTAFATTAMFKDAVKQGFAGVRDSLEGAQLGPMGRAPGEALATVRRGVETAADVAVIAAAPELAPFTGRLLTRGAAGPEPGREGAASESPPLLEGPGGTDGGAQAMLPAPERTGAGPQVMLPVPAETEAASQVMLPEPSGPPLPELSEEFTARRRVSGGQVIYELERRQLVQYTTFLSESAGETPVVSQLPGRAQEA